MSLDFKVVDNYLPSLVFEDLTSLILSNGFPFYFYDTVTDSKKTNDFFFAHVLLDNGAIGSWYYNNVAPHFLELIQPKEVFRIKINAYVKDHDHTVHGFHHDKKEPHKVALWSLNSNNGYTLLVDKESGEQVKLDSVANRMVFFDGSILHSSVSQTDQKLRININFNYL